MRYGQPQRVTGTITRERVPKLLSDQIQQRLLHLIACLQGFQISFVIVARLHERYHLIAERNLILRVWRIERDRLRNFRGGAIKARLRARQPFERCT